MNESSHHQCCKVDVPFFGLNGTSISIYFFVLFCQRCQLICLLACPIVPQGVKRPHDSILCLSFSAGCLSDSLGCLPHLHFPASQAPPPPDSEKGLLWAHMGVSWGAFCTRWTLLKFNQGLKEAIQESGLMSSVWPCSYTLDLAKGF